MVMVTAAMEMLLANCFKDGDGDMLFGERHISTCGEMVMAELEKVEATFHTIISIVLFLVHILHHC